MLPYGTQKRGHSSTYWQDKLTSYNQKIIEARRELNASRVRERLGERNKQNVAARSMTRIQRKVGLI